MLTIKNPFDPITISSIKVLIYGQPGIRKTSYSFTADKPFLIDFDKGIRRLHPVYRKNYAEVESWADVADIANDPAIAGFDTLIFDTAGKMLDLLAIHLMRQNEKLNYQGNLTIQGYGVLKTSFRTWLATLEAAKKNLVFVAHDKEGKEGEETRIRPDVPGGSLATLIREMDLVGYMESRGNVSTITFDPSDRFWGKNSCRIPKITDLDKFPLSKLFEMYAEQQEKINDISNDYKDLMSVIDAKIDTVKDAETAKVAAAELETLAVIWDSKLQARTLFAAKLTAIGLKFNKKEGTYEAIPEKTGA